MPLEFELSNRGHKTLTVGSMVMFVAPSAADLPSILIDLAKALDAIEGSTGLVVLPASDDTPIVDRYSDEGLHEQHIAVVRVDGDLMKGAQSIAGNVDKSNKEALERIEAYGTKIRQRVQRARVEPSFN